MDANTPPNAVDHDKLFKELLTTFFVEFVQAFLPDVAAYLDPDSLEFLDKEVFTDIASGEKHEVDVIVKARYRNQDAFFLIHVENQASAQGDFPIRMFRYFARLYEKYHLPVYPVVIFSYDAPKRPEPKQHCVTFPGFVVNRFQYRVIQLNRLGWRRFVKQPNPAATALMTKMKMAEGDRPKVKLQCLRLLLTLKLDAARSELIFLFMERYLRLTSEEERRYQQQAAALLEPERSQAMELVSSYRLQGREEGREEGRAEAMELVSSYRLQGREEGRTEGAQAGKSELIARQMEKRFGLLTKDARARLDSLTSAQLDDLGLALFDLKSREDVEGWLDALP